MIDEAQVGAYRDAGYVLLRDVLAPERIVELRAVADAFVAGASRLTGSDEILDLDPRHTPEQPKVRRIKAPHDKHPAFAALARDPAILGAVAALIGPDIRLHGSKLNLKSAHDGAAVQWHQDWAFYPHTNDDLLAVGIPLDDCGPDNGPLLVVPGTHRGPIHDHHQGGRFVGAFDADAARLDTAGAVPLLARAGDITIHHVRLVHGSAVNRSARPRRLILFEYAAGDAWPLRPDTGGYEEHLAMMVAGRLSLQPRMLPLPVRIPFPSTTGETIYQLQESYAGAPVAAQ